MIARWSVFGVDLAWKVTKNFVIFPSVRDLQRCPLYHVVSHNLLIDTGEGLRGGMDHKKQKTVSRVWRKVSTQSSSNQGYLVKDVKIASENLHAVGDGKKNTVGTQEKEDRSISSNITIQNENEVGVGDDQNLSSGSLQMNDEVGGLEGQATSAEKQSISVEAVHSVGKHSIAIEVGASLIRFIKGKDGATQKNIEDETGVKIVFPSSKREDSIVIEGDSAESVTRASRRIQIVVDEAVSSPRLDYSHFVSLPLAVHPELVDKLIKFQNSILGITQMNRDESLKSGSDADTSDEEHEIQHLDKASEVVVKLKAEDGNEHVNVNITTIPLVSYPTKMSKAPVLESKTSKLSELGIERSIFIKPKTFHLTVLMLKLWNKDRVEAAAKVLQSVSSKVIDVLESRPVSIRLEGLECMRGSFAKAGVLYAPIEEIGGEGRLLRACQVIIDAFVEAGLVLEKDAQHKLKLHATVMNARHRKRKGRTKKGKFDFFDARGIVDLYGSEEWGEYLIPEAHLSQRFLFDENGYYHCCASIPFPENMQLD